MVLPHSSAVAVSVSPVERLVVGVHDHIPSVHTVTGALLQVIVGLDHERSIVAPITHSPSITV